MPYKTIAYFDDGTINDDNVHVFNNVDTACRAAFNDIYHDRQIVTTHPAETDPIYEIVEYANGYQLTAKYPHQPRHICETIIISPINN